MPEQMLKRITTTSEVTPDLRQYAVIIELENVTKVKTVTLVILKSALSTAEISAMAVVVVFAIANYSIQFCVEILLGAAIILI